MLGSNYIRYAGRKVFHIQYLTLNKCNIITAFMHSGMLAQIGADYIRVKYIIYFLNNEIS